MQKRSDDKELPVESENLFEKMIGFGENSVHKSYYPALQENIIELKKAEEKYYNLFKNALNGIFQTTPDGKIINANQALARMFGYDTPEELMHAITDLKTKLYVNPADRDRLQEILKKDGKAINFVTQYYKKDGTKMWASLNIQAFYNKNGEIEFYEGFSEDITGRVHAEETVALQLKELEEKNIALERFNEELREFAYIASHDLQEPMRKSQNFCDILKLKCYHMLDDYGRTYLDKIFKENHKIRLLISSLLEYAMAARELKNFEKIKLNDLINEVQNNIVNKYKQVEVNFEIDSNLPTICGDRELLLILFYNILDNSVKFRKKSMPLKILICCKNISLQRVEISIIDNGIGFNNDYSGKIFNLFERLNASDEYEGVGVGLPICRKIVHSHGGTIKAVGNEGVCTDIVITLPLE